MSEHKVSRWWHYKAIKAPRYLVLSALAIAFCICLSLYYQDWQYFGRSGAIVALLGGLLALRKLLRKGTRNFASPNEPLVINGNQFNTKAMWQEVQELSDSFAQELGLILVVVGTFISSFGDLVLQVIWPLPT